MGYIGFKLVSIRWLERRYVPSQTSLTVVEGEHVLCSIDLL